MTIEPFNIQINDSTLADLRQRLKATRWPEEIEGSGWGYGSDLSYMRSLTEYWLNGYSWRDQEAKLNKLAHFKTMLDGQEVHFIHERGKGPKPMPLIISHGWPGSFVEMMKALPLLTDPASHGGNAEDAFDVIVPSLPGFGFSAPPRVAGMGPVQIADLWAQLMSKLGYDKFFAQGGDWGAAITTALGLNYPDRVSALHLNYIAGRFLLGGTINDAPDDPAAQELVGKLRAWWDEEGGYNHQQSTRPQTLGFALNDSPVGLAAWLVEKFRAWSDCDGNIETIFSRDELLTNIMLYWLSGSVTSSLRIYFESRQVPLKLSSDNRVAVPVGVAVFPKEIPMPPKPLAEKGYNIMHWNPMTKGGHFAAMEQPEIFANEVRTYFKQFR